MLHWLAGQRPADRDTDGHLEPPETPAPLFAVRAFKQAIFGTPAPQQSPRTRRNSIHDRETARNSTKPSRPLMTRPRSANDANAGLRIDDLPPSPTKGILLTPGTIGERRKTVTFGDYVPAKGGQSEDDLRNSSLKRENPFETRVGRAADDNRKSRKQTAGESISDETNAYCKHGQDAMDMIEQEPECVVGRYWKREYDLYRDNTSRELRKLIAKQQAAKSYAREKDEQCTVLNDELRDERRKIDRLEEKNRQLEAMLDDLRAQLALTTSTVASVKDVPANDQPGYTAPAPEIRAAHTSTSDYTTGRDRAVPSISEARPSRSYASNGIAVEALASNSGSSRRRARRHDSFEPGSSCTISEVKQESTVLAELPTTFTASPAVGATAHQTQAQSETKTITSKAGEVIPPDRIAAARARLAARRQQRIAS